MKASLARVLASLTEEEAEAVYHGLAQWADNERNGLEETEPHTDDEKREHARTERYVSLAEGVVERLDAEICKLAS